MNHQIIENAPFRDHFNVHVILWRIRESTQKQFREEFANADDITRFEYSRFDNYYQVLKRFSHLLARWPGVLVTNDGIELEAVERFGTCSKVTAIVHDSYNLRLALNNLVLVDYFMCHTEVFFRALKSGIVNHSDKIGYLLHGVRIPEKTALIRRSGRLRILSIARLNAFKGVLHLSAIDDRLRQAGVEVEWSIVGSGEVEKEMRKQWEGKEHVQFHKPDSREDVLSIALNCDIFISASSFEGYGIALLDAMSCGLVPVVYRLPVGVYSDLPGEVGFSVEPGNLAGLAESIIELNADRSRLADMSAAARRLVEEKYDISRTAPHYMEFLVKAQNGKMETPVKVRRNRKGVLGFFDKPYIPNPIARLYKKFRYR